MTRPKSATLVDVAQRARVSTATVSRVVNASGVVRSATRSRVIRAIDELDYRPDERARALARGESRTLGMIVSNLRNDFYLDIFQALEREARRCGYDVVVANTDYHSERLPASVRAMAARRVAGLALVVTELARELGEQALPVVVYGAGAPVANITRIRVGDYQCTRRIVEYLYGLGHRRFAFVGHHAGPGPLQERQRAFVDTLTGRGDGVESMIAADSDSPYGGLQATRLILESDYRPTAIVCLNDYMALGVLKGLREAGLDVPGDVSVTGFDGVSLARFANPTLTTIAVPREWIGRSAATALMPDSEGNRTGQDIEVAAELLIRESTGPAPAPARGAG